MLFKSCSDVACLFDKTPTFSIVVFEVYIIVMTIIFLFILSKFKNKILLRYLIIAIGVFIFEFFTSTMWNNFHMGEWAYVYRDVSWILTLGWSIMILFPIIIVDKYLPHFKEWQKFLIYIFFIFLFALLGEKTVVELGIRSYTPESMEVIKDHFMPFFNIPWSSVYYIPVFISLVIGFYKYWAMIVDGKIIMPMKKRRWFRDLLITLIGVILFEIMIEPMVLNAKLPEWSYFYRDVSIILSGIWILIIWLSISLVDKYLPHFNLYEKFLSYLATATLVAAPIEGIMIRSNIRVYGPSTVENFSGYELPFTGVPIEVIFAIPFYLSLVIGFTKYWIFIMEKQKKKIKTED